jgi:hypothetical protein
MKDNSKIVNNNLNNEKIFRELVGRQIKNIVSNKKLQVGDIKRIARKINTSIFDENVCAIWNGYITNINNASKGTYVNFYFRKKKVALHRLLYSNFVGELNEDEYLKFNCENKGKCCNIHHMNKFKYNTIEAVDNDKNSQNQNKQNTQNNQKNVPNQKKKIRNNNEPEQSNDNDNDSSDFILEFD